MSKKQIFIAITAFIFTASCFAQDIVQWRGPNRTGVYNQTGLLKTWPAEGPKMLWSFEGLGKGFTSVTIVGSKIYTTGQTDSIGHIFAFNLQGKLIWKNVYGKEFTEAYPGTRTTPVFNKGNLYIATAFGEAICLNAETGKKIWSVDMKSKFGARVIRFGMVEAPVVVDNNVIFTPGGENVALVALNRLSGETVWKSKATGEKSAYCSPLLFEHKNKKYVVTALENNLVCLDPVDGSMIWNIAQKNTNSIHPNTPFYKDGYIYSLTGYKGGGVMIKLSDDGKTATDVWRNTTLDNQMGGAIWLDNTIVSSGHMSDRSWQCLNAKTGEVLFKSAEIGKGAVIYADGLYYCYAESGDLGIMELNDKGFTVKSKTKIALGTEQHWAHPVIDNGVLYVRHGNALMAYSIKI